MRNDINKFVVILHQFLLYYFSADKKQIEYYLDSINSFLYSGIIVNYYAALVRYYNACVKFIQSEYNASYLLLQDVKNLEQDKKSWNISIRILGIQNQIELENYELADSLIENLRKHYERIQKTMQVTKRDEAIIRILTSLSRHSYNFRKTYRLKLEAFNRLSSLEKGYRWKILSPEMILFHEWFLAKMNAGRYKHFELMPEVRKKYSSIYK